MSQPRILCFGEVLWDHLPHGRFLGGAPINVAFHLKKLGCHPLPVTAVGDDAAGDEIRHRLDEWGLDTRFVGRVPGKATGIVRVHLSDPNRPAYEIVAGVAWDEIPSSAALWDAARQAQGLVFGSLAQRSVANRARLDKLLQTVIGLKVFDVNLRPPFVDEGRIFALARQSDIIKLNDQELSELLHGASAAQPLSVQASRLAERTGCAQICVTAGKQGAGWWRKGEWTWVPARPVEAAGADAVGAGDAFLAALVASVLEHPQPSGEAILQWACRLAEFVARNPGATPEYDPQSLFKAE